MDRNEAIKVIKDNWSESRPQLSEALQTLIPELQDSEDERIREECIAAVKTAYADGENRQKCIAWLEKQDEQKPAEDNCKISDCVEKVDMTEYNNGYECGKQRVLKYPEDYGLCKKSTWSEEDERKSQLLLAIFDDIKGDSATYSTMYREIEELKIWFNSLKERKR